MDLIVTDLTRFAKDDIVCIAGIDVKSEQCIRPLPYLPKAECKRLKLLPGAILEGKFTRPKRVDKPHTEDMNYTDLSFKGPCMFRWFKCILKCQHFLSLSQNGLAIQIYCALIASLLISLWSGHKVGKRTYEMLCLHMQGWASDQELEKHLESLKKKLETKKIP